MAGLHMASFPYPEGLSEVSPLHRAHHGPRVLSKLEVLKKEYQERTLRAKEQKLLTLHPRVSGSSAGPQEEKTWASNWTVPKRTAGIDRAHPLQPLIKHSAPYVRSKSGPSRTEQWQELENRQRNLEDEIRRKEALLREKLRRTEEELRRIQREKTEAEPQGTREAKGRPKGSGARKDRPLSIDQYNQGGKGRPLSIDQYNQGGKDRPFSIDQYNQGGKDRPLSIDQYNQGGKDRPLSIDQYNHGGKDRPLSIDQYNQGGKGRPLSIDQYNKGRKDRPLSIDQYIKGGKDRPLTIDQYNKGRKDRPLSIDQYNEGRKDRPLAIDQNNESRKDRPLTIDRHNEGRKDRPLAIDQYNEGRKERPLSINQYNESRKDRPLSINQDREGRKDRPLTIGDAYPALQGAITDLSGVQDGGRPSFEPKEEALLYRKVPESPEQQLVPCPWCGRRFMEHRLQKHTAVCEKAHGSRRKVFDSSKARAKGTDLEQYLLKKGRQPSPAPQVKASSWRKKHESFLRTIRQARVVQDVVARGGRIADLPPVPPEDNPDYVACPHCSRRFSPRAAERHIPKCETIKSRPRPPPSPSPLIGTSCHQSHGGPRSGAAGVCTQEAPGALVTVFSGRLGAATSRGCPLHTERHLQEEEWNMTALAGWVCSSDSGLLPTRRGGRLHRYLPAGLTAYC